MSRFVSSEEARGLLEGAPGPLTAELDVFDPDECEAEASIHTNGVTVLFTAGTGQTFPTGTQNTADLERWRALNDSEPMRYARLFAAAPDLANTVIALTEERERLLVDAKEREHRGAIVAKLNQDGATLAMEELARQATRAEVERDRLRAILACERGEKAPEGWEWVDHEDAWIKTGMNTRVDRHEAGRWQAYRWTGQEERELTEVQPTALEAIEAADIALGETP